VAPRLSIIVPFFGVEAYIGDCLRSLSGQTFDDFEVVLIDDGSLDGSAAIAADFASRDSRFRIITQENRGLGMARNAGVKGSVGEFIAFVDSDDVVPRRAFESMIDTLDLTGSSFAAGDVRRFNSRGMRESLLHSGPFAHRRLATHVLEFPALAVDRIMCNKVYRRKFWDEFAYEFPAIRYEDYPIALRSHLDAVTVDCLDTPVYFWRFRDSGGSITDHSHEYTNLVDRVSSAEMVIDLVSRRAKDLETRVHRHLLRVDLLPLLEAFRTAPADEERQLAALGQRLLERLDETVLNSARPFDRLQIDALRRSDVTALRELAGYRHVHDGNPRVRARRRWNTPWVWDSHIPDLTDRASHGRRSTGRLRKEEFSLHTTVTAVTWRGSTVVVRGTAEIQHLQVGRRSRLRLALTGGGIEVPCEVARFMTLDSYGEFGLVGFEVHIDGTTFASFPKAATVVHMSAEVINGAVRRRGWLGGLQAGSPEFAQGRWVRGDFWVQPRQGVDGRLAFDLLENPAQLTSITVCDGAFILSGLLPRDVVVSRLALTGPSSSHGRTASLDLRSEGSDLAFTCRMPIVDIAADFDSTDPFAQTMTLPVQLGNVESPRSTLIPAGLDRAVGVVHDSLLVLLTRTRNNSAAFSVSRRCFVVNEIGTEHASSHPKLVVSGSLWASSESPRAFVWRGHPEQTDVRVDVWCARSTSDGGWSAVVDVEDLITKRPLASASGVARLTTYTLFGIAFDGSAHAVQVDGFLSSQLPMEVHHRGRTATILPEASRLRVVIR
jgi:glycosyltransferase involved in cell wall biosynthesis